MSTVAAVVGQHAAAIAADSSNYTIVATPHGPQVAAGVVFGAHPKLVAANGRAAGVAGVSHYNEVSFVDIVGQALAVAPTLDDVARTVLTLAGATLAAAYVQWLALGAHSSGPDLRPVSSFLEILVIGRDSRATPTLLSLWAATPAAPLTLIGDTSVAQDGNARVDLDGRGTDLVRARTEQHHRTNPFVRGPDYLPWTATPDPGDAASCAVVARNMVDIVIAANPRPTQPWWPPNLPAVCGPVTTATI
jgi:hypothetical protein